MPKRFDDEEEGMFTYMSKRRSDRYKVSVEFTVEADTPEDAEQLVKELIQEGILLYASEQEEENGLIIDSYDVIDSEPAEINLDTV